MNINVSHNLRQVGASCTKFEIAKLSLHVHNVFIREKHYIDSFTIILLLVLFPHFTGFTRQVSLWFGQSLDSLCLLQELHQSQLGQTLPTQQKNSPCNGTYLRKTGPTQQIVSVKDLILSMKSEKP